MCDSYRGFLIHSAMSHTDLEKIFEVFKREFPPAAKYLDGVTLKLTTSELLRTLTDFCPDIVIDDIVSFMTSHGYVYLPIEYNEEITFYWLLEKSKASESF